MAGQASSRSERLRFLIIIVAERGVGFPNGTGATARVTGYARGLQACGAEVQVLCLGTSEPSSPEAVINTAVKGVAGGISFEYACGSTVRSTSFWRRRWLRIKGLIGVGRRIRQQRGSKPMEAILLYSRSWLDAAFLRLATLKVGAVLIADVSEMPFSQTPICHPRASVFARLRRRLYNRTFFRWFDACIVVSDRLREHVAVFGTRDMAVLKVPVIVDTDEFRPIRRIEEFPRVILYCGLLNQRKDGVVTLMRAFGRIVAEFPDVRLRLIGDAEGSTRIPQFRTIAEHLGIVDKVSFVGTVERSEVPVLLAAASVLVLARPRSLQADAGMPTKVAEYLASGAPVLITKTGEIATFLDDGLSAYIVPPDDEAAVAEALRHILAHPAEALAVGRRGRDVAIRHFDYRVVGSQVAAFIADLNDHRAMGARRFSQTVRAESRRIG